MSDKFFSKSNAERVFGEYADKIKSFDAIPITKAEYDILSEDDKASHRYIIIDFPDGDIIDLSTETVTGNPLSFTTDSEQAARSCVITLKPIQAGSGDPSPTNVREISGYKEIKLAVPRKNLWSFGNVSGTEYVSKFNTNNYPALLKAGKTYTLSCVATSSDTDATTCRIQFYSKNNTSIAYYLVDRNNRSSITFSLEEDCYKVTFYASDRGSLSTGDTFSFTYIQLELGSQATAYEPYNPITDISQPLPQTIYGGTLDVESGVLTVTRKRIDMGNLTWNYGSGSQVFSASISDKKDGNAHFVCDSYKDGGSTGYAVGNKEIAYNTGTNYMKTVFIKDTDYSTKETFTTAVTGKYLVYDLATPYTLQLTPAQVRLLQGANVVTSNGTSIALTYRNGEVASLEDVSSVAESVNALGELVALHNTSTENIDLTPYTSGTGGYKFPYDGYVRISSEQVSSGTIEVTILDDNAVILAFMHLKVTATKQRDSVFVKKGMRAKVGTVTSGCQVTYRGLNI